MSVFGRPFAAALAVAALLFLAACAGAPKPAQVAGSLQPSADMNPSNTGRASPLLVRVYELKSLAAFNKADFMSLYQRDQAELAADLVGKEEFILAPGEPPKPFSKTLSPDTRFLGVLAAYRDLEHASWRSSVPIKAGQKQRVVIRAGALAVEAVAQ